MPDVYGNLSNQFPDITAMTSDALVRNNAPLTNLNNNLAGLNTKLTTLQGQSNALLTKQDSVNTIVTNEHNRLEQKKESVDNAYSSQQRAIYMNDNIQKRYNAYSKMLIALVIGATILFALSFLQSYVPFIPSFIFIISYIIIISAVTIYSINIYKDIQKHERLDYDRLYMKPMSDADNVVISSSGDFSLNLPTSGLCGSGTVMRFVTDQYGIITPTCLPSSTNGFQNMDGLGNLNHEEFTSYSEYK